MTSRRTKRSKTGYLKLLLTFLDIRNETSGTQRMSCAIETKLTKIWATPFIDLNELSCVPEIYIGLLRVERGNNINKYDFVHNLASTLLSDVYNDNKAK